jgi:glycosyltransferase involved in cell wall biosynthesis
MPSISVIVCTYRREATLAVMLRTLERQTFHDFEVLVVHAGDGTPRLFQILEQFDARMRIQLIVAMKGLPLQRNAGLREATGGIIAFLDDDVTLPEAFLGRVVELFASPEMRDVGGITGYDEKNYGCKPAGRYMVRRCLGCYPDFQPGGVGLCSSTIPLSWAKPFSGARDVHWLPGFCSIYRRDAINGLRFDAQLTGYGAEDALFSIAVARKWRLAMCGDLRLQHHFDPAARSSDDTVVYGASFALARLHFSAPATAVRILQMSWYALLDFSMDALAFVRVPSVTRWRVITARQRGLWHGFLSTRTAFQALAAK